MLSTVMTQNAALEDRVIAILAFHKIGEPPPGGWVTWNYIPEKMFEVQLRQVRDAGWKWISAADLVAAIDHPERLPRRSALLTFDDGYLSMRSIVLPILQRHDAPAVLFVPTAYIGGSSEFDAGSEPEESICNWADLRALETAGISIQSHSVLHRRFSDLSLAEQEWEASYSKSVLEAGLQKPVEFFAFPFGDAGRQPTELAQVLKRAGYRAACLYGGGAIRLPASDPYRLSRIAMGPDSQFEALDGYA
jgi:peptidoglycan/xylan/chitin deacetylase (PgdA/CDA1 family)